MVYKQYVNIIAQKPDIIPEHMLSDEYIDELRKIDRLAVLEITGTANMSALYTALKDISFEAVLPTISYSGTEYGEWKYIFNGLQAFKKVVEKNLNIFVFAPVLLGAPQFWWALNGRYIKELMNRYMGFTPCLGCRLYAYALRIPLCKRLDISVILSGIAKNGEETANVHETDSVIHYCKNLLSSFGIQLICRTIDYNELDKFTELMNGTHDKMQGACFNCILKDNFKNLDGDYSNSTDMNQYFEQFAIPAAAKILSRVLSGRGVDYACEVKNTLLPIEQPKRKYGAAGKHKIMSHTRK
ncbi:MAG: hypothetical protein NTZ51_03440 [Proteobacteria bacterium]|nr:hypothetical protein [Pseudomonadota bacterium]